MCKKNVDIELNEGLNLINCSRIVQLVSNFKVNVLLKNGTQSADAQSIIGLLTLGAVKGDRIEVAAQGEDELKIVLELERLLEGAG